MIDWIRSLAFLAIIVYSVLDYFDGRRIKDEREELIRLKSLEFTHKASLVALAVLALSYVFIYGISVQLVILVMIAVSLYGEIAAKFFYRRRL